MEGDSPDTDVLWSEITRYFEEGSFMACACHKPSLCAGTGLIPSHAYALLRPVEIKTSDGRTVQLLHVRNPWGHAGEWIGDWGDRSSTWESIDSGTKAEIGYVDADDGTFYIELADFCKVFDALDVGRTLATNPRWSSATFAAPITAEIIRGSLSYVDFPQYQVVLEGDAPQELVVTATGPSPRVAASIAPRGSRAPPTPRLVLLVSCALDEGTRYGPRAKVATMLNDRITRWDRRTVTYCFPNTPPGCYNVMLISDRPGTVCLRVFTDGPSRVTELVSGCEFSTAAPVGAKATTPQLKLKPKSKAAASAAAPPPPPSVAVSVVAPAGGKLAAGGGGGGGPPAAAVRRTAAPEPISPGTFDFNLADQSAVLSDMSWATSKLRLVRSSDVAAMSGGHRFFLLSMPKYTNTTVTLATTDGASPLGLYALTFSPAAVEVPPNTKRVVSKEASIKGSGDRKVNAMALNHPYALLIGVCGGKGVCSGSFRLTVEVKKR